MLLYGVGRTSFTPQIRRHSSAGQSARFTSVRSWVQVPLSPPKEKGTERCLFLLVQRHLAQPNAARCGTSEQSPLCSGFFFCLRQKRSHPPAPLLLLFRKRARSARLLGCKRPRDGSLSLPPFCGCLRSKLTDYPTRQGPGATRAPGFFLFPKFAHASGLI